MRCLGARMAANAADQQAKALNQEYEATLGACLKMLDLDERTTWRVNLDTGELEPAESSENGAAQQGIVLGR